MIRFGREELVSFLRALDRNLPAHPRASLVIIGGAAAAIAHDSGTRTSDIDLYQGFSREVARAAERARTESGLAVAVSSAAVADLPHDHEDRLRPARGLRFRHMTALFPDKYDLALSKTVRGYQHDIDAIEGIHRHHRLSRKTLLERFESEMQAAITDPRKLRLNMVMVVARLYGVAEGRKLAARWGTPAPVSSQ